MAEEAGGGDRLGKNDADGDEDGSATRSIGDGDVELGAFGILVAAAEGDAALGEVFADGHFFLKAAAANAGEDASAHARTVAAREDAIFFAGGCWGGVGLGFGADFHPDRRRIANFADPRDGFANFEGFQLEFIQVNDFAALAEAALHEQARDGFLGAIERRKLDAPEIVAMVQDVEGVEEAFGFVVDFSDDAGADGNGLAGFENTLKREFVAPEEFIRESEDAAIAADEKSVSGALEDDAFGGKPGGFERHAEGDAVALAFGFGAGGGHERGRRSEISDQRSARTRSGKGGMDCSFGAVNHFGQNPD